MKEKLIKIIKEKGFNYKSIAKASGRTEMDVKNWVRGSGAMKDEQVSNAILKICSETVEEVESIIKL